MAPMETLADYRVKQEAERIGRFDFSVLCLRSLDETIDELFEKLRDQGQENLLNELCPYFGRIWPSARALAEELAELGSDTFSGETALELGCGLALPSLTLARLGAQVTATDSHPAVEEFFRRNKV